MSVSVSIVRKVSRTKKILDKLDANGDRALADILTLIHSECVKLLYSHESQGRVYKSSVSQAKHVASKPGYAPNSDSKELAKSIAWYVDKAKGMGEVGTNTKYGKWLEFGTKNIAPRPWLSRVIKKNKTRIAQLFISTIKKSTK